MAVTVALAWMVVPSATGAALHAPTTVVAGQALTVQSEGSGDATFYLLGPATAFKQAIRLGSNVEVSSQEVSAAGEYQAIACSGDDCVHTTFEVRAGQPARLSFFLHPSRVPVATPGAITGTAFLFDRYYNPVFDAAKVEFQIAPSTAVGSQVVTAERGIAWMGMSSSKKEGPVRITATSGELTVPRLIQQVAAEACGLRMKATPAKGAFNLETDPVRDCSGNPLPDGTIVSFTTLDSSGKTTVDAPIKKGVARTRMSIHGRARVSVACGVVLGNELSIAGGV
jgi:hypothetical protein